MEDLLDIKFINRSKEFELLSSTFSKSRFVVIFGRRRVGKTRFLRHWLDQNSGVYSQAIQSESSIQIEQIWNDFRLIFKNSIQPKTWSEFFELLSMVKEKLVVCIDEFPYLVKADKSLPSILQKFLDHQIPKGMRLIVSGSSQTMMHALFLNATAPLYQRAGKVVKLEPMAFGDFCKALKISAEKEESFLLYSLVGGIPKYWEFLNPNLDSIANATELYFSNGSYLEGEPQRLLEDEGINNDRPRDFLNAIGRGAERLSEIAGKLAVPITDLGRIAQVLVDCSLVERMIPFGESIRSTKRSLYRLNDPSLRFWFRVFSPHQSRWAYYTTQEKINFIREHTGAVLELEFRKLYPGSARFWEGNIEIDCVREEGKGNLIVSELKLKIKDKKERQLILDNLKLQFASSSLSKKYSKVTYEVFDWTDIRDKI